MTALTVFFSFLAAVSIVGLACVGYSWAFEPVRQVREILEVAEREGILEFLDSEAFEYLDSPEFA